jgi:hypothetical protein
MNSDIDPPAEQDVCAEIFDMACVANTASVNSDQRGITFEGSFQFLISYSSTKIFSYEFLDLVACGQGSTILSMLVDVTAFWQYDNRESLMQV